MQEILSLQNPKVQHIKKLKDKTYRRKTGQYFIEGENIVKDLPDWVEVEAVFVQKDRLSDYLYILSRYSDDKIYVVDDKVMKSISDTVTPSGILVLIKIVHREIDVSGNVVVLDGISDPGNMGTIIRTCVACDIRQIIAINCVDYTSGKVLRSSMSGIFKLNISEVDYDKCFEVLKNHTIYALDMSGENIFDMKSIKRPFALVVGNESRGLSKIMSDNSKIVSLPMTKDIESLNAGVSLATALYQFVYNKNL